MSYKPASEAIVNMDVETVLDLADALVYIKSGLESGHVTLNLDDKTSTEEATAELVDAISDLARHLAGLIMDASHRERANMYASKRKGQGFQVVVDADMRVISPEKFAEAMENPENTIVFIPPEPIES